MTSRTRILLGGSLLLGALLAAVWGMELGLDEPAATAGEALGEPSEPPGLAAAPPIAACDLEPWVRPVGGVPPGQLRIEEEDSRAAIAGATVTLVGGEPEVVLGRTDARGIMAAAWPDSPPPWRVRVEADGYLAGEVSCDRETWRLSMVAEGSIHGRVEGALPSLLAAGRVEVRAWDTSGESFVTAGQGGRRATAKIRKAVVQADGSFHLRGLRRGRPHTVMAIGPSFGSQNAAEDVPADGRSIVLEGMTLHGALIRITGPNGASLLGGRDVRQTDPPSRTRLLAKDPQPVLPGDDYLPWLGLEPSTSDDDSDVRQFLVYLPAGDSADVELTVARPGYETWSGVVTLPPLSRPLAEVAVVLQPWTLEFGSVEVVLRGLESIGQRPQADARSPDAELHFVASGLRGAQADRPLALTAAIPDLAKFPLVVGPLPAGDYVVSLRGGFALLGAESGEEENVLRVRADRVAKVEFDLATLGVVDVSLATSRSAYFGPAQVLLRSKHGRGSWSFSGAPYRIPMLPPGDYEVGLVGEGAMPAAEELMLPISVHEGRIARIFLPVNR